MLVEKLTELFCDVDDFCQSFIPQWERQLIESGEKQRRRSSQMVRVKSSQSSFYFIYQVFATSNNSIKAIFVLILIKHFLI